MGTFWLLSRIFLYDMIESEGIPRNYTFEKQKKFHGVKSDEYNGKTMIFVVFGLKFGRNCDSIGWREIKALSFIFTKGF